MYLLVWVGIVVFLYEKRQLLQSRMKMFASKILLENKIEIEIEIIIQ